MEQYEWLDWQNQLCHYRILNIAICRRGFMSRLGLGALAIT